MDRLTKFVEFLNSTSNFINIDNSLVDEYLALDRKVLKEPKQKFLLLDFLSFLKWKSKYLYIENIVVDEYLKCHCDYCHKFGCNAHKPIPKKKKIKFNGTTVVSMPIDLFELNVPFYKN